MSSEDRFAGIGFSAMFALLGWAFAPFDTQPEPALVVSVILSVIGIGSAVYFWSRRT